LAERRGGIAIVATVAAGVALYFAQEVFVPVALGLLGTALFRPLVRGFSRVGISAPVSATLIVVGCLGLVAATGYFIAGPVRSWVQDAPKTVAAARSKIEKLRRPIEQVSDAVEKAQQQVTGEQPGTQKAQPAPAAPGSPVPSLVGRVFATTAGILSTLLQTLVIVFVVLATGDLFNRKLALLLPRPAQGTTEDVVEDAESVIRRYLIVTILLAAGQGVVIALLFMLIGMPSPVLWGVLTLALESIPYIGALIMVAAVTVTAFAAFDSIGQILLPPLTYIVVSGIQNNLISPFAYGTGLQLNPLVVLLIVLVGWFLWGGAGAFVAVPLLAGVRVFAERLNRNSRLAGVLAE
jgi:predicted PurR-regulated permease PerM